MSVTAAIFLLLLILAGAAEIHLSEEDNCPEVSVHASCTPDHVNYWLYDRNMSTPIKVRRPRIEGQLVILVHGFAESRHNSGINVVGDEILEAKLATVISMDYSTLVPRGCYIDAIKNSRYVGRCLAEFIDDLVSDKIHLIGYSLGAQVCGVAGAFVTRKVSRISGLDPSKNLFITANNDSYRLDPSDAEFVDILTTDPAQRGYLSGAGHLTYYPNFGFAQPSCYNSSLSEHELSLCNHKLAPVYYAESVSRRKFYAAPCTKIHLQGHQDCSSKREDIQEMGYHVDTRLRGSYFSRTFKEPPYGMGVDGAFDVK